MNMAKASVLSVASRTDKFLPKAAPAGSSEEIIVSVGARTPVHPD